MAIITNIIFDRLVPLAKQNRYSLVQLSTTIGKGSHWLYDVRRGNASVRYEDVKALAELLHCAPEYLIGEDDAIQAEPTSGESKEPETKKEEPTIESIEGELTFQFIKMLSGLTREQRQSVMVLMKSYLESNK